MKLSELTPTDKNKLAAELDGSLVPHTPTPEEVATGSYYQWKPQYEKSYDLSIPLIQKQDATVRTRIAVQLSIGQNGVARCFDYLMKTPSQLLDALLIATGKAEL